MFLINNILVEENIYTQKFSCDLKKCKGACCTFPGENGAPLIDNELELIRKNLNAAKQYLSKRSLKVLEDSGFYEGTKGDYSTVCIDKKDCVFVFYEGDVAKCAIEKAYFAGESDFRKPLSCHLFPIRQGNFGGKYLYYEKIKECKPALEAGEQEDVVLIDYLKDPLIRAFGEEWYENAKKQKQ